MRGHENTIPCLRRRQQLDEKPLPILSLADPSQIQTFYGEQDEAMNAQFRWAAQLDHLADERGRIGIMETKAGRDHWQAIGETASWFASGSRESRMIDIERFRKTLGVCSHMRTIAISPLSTASWVRPHHKSTIDIMNLPQPSASRGLVIERGGTTRNPLCYFGFHRFVGLACHYYPRHEGYPDVMVAYQNRIRSACNASTLVLCLSDAPNFNIEQVQGASRKRAGGCPDASRILRHSPLRLARYPEFWLATPISQTNFRAFRKTK
jgi:hypothetical protein